MTNNIKKLIDEGRWKPIAEAPKASSWEGGKSYLLKSSGGGIDIGYWDAWGNRDENGLPEGCEGDASEYVDGWRWGDGIEVYPTHFRALPDDHLADVCDVLLKALVLLSSQAYGQFTRGIAEDAIMKAEAIAGGEKC